MRIFFLCVLFVVFSSGLMAEDITGFWKTINEKTGKAESLIAIYKYQDKYYGRIIITYDSDGKVEDTIYHASARAPGVKGNPYYAGLDIIWDLKPKGNSFGYGKILDPELGNLYDAELWRRKENLMVRGSVLFFGRNQTWLPAKDSDFPEGFQKPNLSELVPVIPEHQSVK